MRIEMDEKSFYSYRQPYVTTFGQRVQPTLSDAVAAFFKDYGFRGTVEVVSIYLSYVEIEVTGALPAIFSTNGQAHGTVYYCKVENPQDYSAYRQ